MYYSKITVVSGSSSFQHYDTTAAPTTTRRYHQLQIHNAASRETSPTDHVSKYQSSTGSRYKSQSPYSVIFRQQQQELQQQQQQQEQDALRGNVSQALGFLLDEKAIITNGLYVVKYVDPNSASSLAGLKTGDRITKINGKLTNDMSYEQFCEEIIIAQQQQQHNNMIHLMVMRKSAKSTASSYAGTGSSSSATAVSSSSNFIHSRNPNRNDYSSPTSPSSAIQVCSNGVAGGGGAGVGGGSSSILTTSTSSNLNMNEKTNSSSFVDEGFVQGSASLSSNNGTATASGAMLVANSSSSSS